MAMSPSIFVDILKRSSSKVDGSIWLECWVNKINMKRKQFTEWRPQDVFDTSFEEIKTDDSSCQTV
jgi:hypothetical protein